MPIFGHSSTWAAQGRSIYDRISSGIFQMGSTNGIVNTITGYFWDWAAPDDKYDVKCAIYDINSNLVAKTSSATLSDNQWTLQTFKITSNIKLLANQSYYLCAWGNEGSIGSPPIQFSGQASEHNLFYNEEDFGDWPEYIPSWNAWYDLGGESLEPIIYCEYTEIEETPLSIEGTGRILFYGGSKELKITTVE